LTGFSKKNNRAGRKTKKFPSSAKSLHDIERTEKKKDKKFKDPSAYI
jgi:hypothetical protein